MVPGDLVLVSEGSSTAHVDDSTGGAESEATTGQEEEVVDVSVYCSALFCFVLFLALLAFFSRSSSDLWLFFNVL